MVVPSLNCRAARETSHERLNGEPHLIPRFRAVLLMRRASVGFPTFAFRERHEQKQYIAGAKWFVLAGFGLGPAAFLERNWKERGTVSLSPALFRWETDRGEPLMLTVPVRPQPAAVAAMSALAATA